MGIVSSLVLFAAGAILKFAVVVNSTHFNLNTIGVILMIVGAVGFVLSLIFWASWGGFGGTRRERTIITTDSGYRDREVV
jgi:type III secretory pathway component EscT